MRKTTTWALSMALATASWFMAAAASAAWPEKPIQIMLPFGTSGVSGEFVRVLADGLTKRLGQPVILLEKPGGGGVVAMQTVKAAKPDGYTLLIGSNGPLTILPALNKATPYDVGRDFVPISIGVLGSHVIVVNTDSPIKTFAEFRAAASSSPGKLNYGSAGNGTTTHLAPAWFDSMNGSKMVHIPYKGIGPVIVALLSNEISVSFSSLYALPYVESGKLRALAVLSEKRLPFAPDIPSVVELGMPELIVESFFGVLAPAGTPKDITDRLRKEITEVMASQEMRDKLKMLLLQPAPDFSAAAFSKRIEEDGVRWRKVVSDNDLKSE